MIEHRPDPPTNIRWGDKDHAEKVYTLKNGSVFVPVRLEGFNPVDEIEKPIKVKKKK